MTRARRETKVDQMVMLSSVYEVAAWQAAVVGAMLAVVQLILGIVKQRSDTRRECAKFGYELMDQMYNEETSCDFLYIVDYINEPQARTATEADVAHAFEMMFGKGARVSDELARKVYDRLDSFLYYLDRFEHSIEAGLATFDDVRIPTEYYAKTLAPYRGLLEPYIASIGYERSLRFLARLKCGWE